MSKHIDSGFRCLVDHGEEGQCIKCAICERNIPPHLFDTAWCPGRPTATITIERKGKIRIEYLYLHQLNLSTFEDHIREFIQSEPDESDYIRIIKSKKL